SEGFAVVCQNGKYGFVNTKGDLVISCQYDNALSFTDGLARVCMDGKYGFINTKGRLIIPYQYDAVGMFS
ncbi:WG repeat-containing protein, partial [Campylobacter jejuni]